MGNPTLSVLASACRKEIILPRKPLNGPDEASRDALTAGEAALTETDCLRARPKSAHTKKHDQLLRFEPVDCGTLLPPRHARKQGCGRS